MEDESTLGKIKEIISKYIVFILLFLIVLVVIILFLPSNKNQKQAPITSTLTLSLKGNSNISIQKGDVYVEAGYYAYDSKEGDLTSRVVVDGSVDTNIIGTYTIRYKVTNSMGKTSEATRIVNVTADLSDVKAEIDYEPKELTNTDVTITLKVSGDGYDFTLDPDGNISKSGEITYKAPSNDEYIFSIKRKDGSVIEKIVEVKNIDKIKPTGSCKNVITLEKTVVTVTAKDSNGIKNYSYNFNGNKYDSNTDSYTINEIARDVVVTIYDKASNYEMINCIKVDNTWPVFEHQNYTISSAKYYDQTRKYNRLNYLFYYPDNLDLSKKNALVIFLHGAGEFGSNIGGSFNQNTAFANNMKSGKFQQRAVFLAPQCYSSSKSWKRDCFKDLKGLIDEVVQKYNIDTKRISVTGHSLGGGAVYDVLVEFPGLFSAAVPLAPAGGSKDYTKMKDVKIAVFTGTNDGLYSSSKSTVDYLAKNGVNIKFYPLQGKGHAAQPPVFDETNTIEWMIAQSR